ncbi:MAG: hypothetical protein AAF961_08525, partial [Planctomycetota bacterium]
MQKILPRVLFVATGLSQLSLVGVSSARQNKSPAGEPIVQVGHADRLEHAVFQPDGRLLVTTARYYEEAASLQSAMLWDARRGEKLHQFPPSTSQSRPAFCLDGAAVMIGGVVWDVKSGQPMTPRMTRAAAQQGELAALDASGNYWIGVVDGSVQVRDLRTGTISGVWSLLQFRDPPRG